MLFFSHHEDHEEKSVDKISWYNMEKNELKSLLDNLSLVTQIGLMVVVSLGLGLGLGFLAARWSGYEVLPKILGGILGLAAGIYQAYRLVMEKIK